MNKVIDEFLNYKFDDSQSHQTERNFPSYGTELHKPSLSIASSPPLPVYINPKTSENKKSIEQIVGIREFDHIERQLKPMYVVPKLNKDLTNQHMTSLDQMIQQNDFQLESSEFSVIDNLYSSKNYSNSTNRIKKDILNDIVTELSLRGDKELWKDCLNERSPFLPSPIMKKCEVNAIQDFHNKIKPKASLKRKPKQIDYASDIN